MNKYSGWIIVQVKNFLHDAVVSFSLHKKLLDLALEYAKDTESECDIKNDTSKSGLGSRVESHESFVLKNLCAAVEDTVIFVCVDTLEARLNNINWVVSHDGAEASERTREKITEHLHADVVLEEL